MRGLSDWVASQGFEVTDGYATDGHNAGSPHYAGHAVDVRTKDRKPEEVEALMEAARSAGYVVRDERVRPAGQGVWDGPHVHLEYDALDKLLAGLPRGPVEAQPAPDELDALLDELGPVERINARNVVEGAPLGPPAVARDLANPAPQPGLTGGARGARALLRVPVPRGRGGEELTGAELAGEAARVYARGKGIPDEYVSRWLAANGAELKTYDLKTGEPREPRDLMGDPQAYDAEAREFLAHAEVPYLRRLADDYFQETVGRPRTDNSKFDALSDPQTTAGEKALRFVDYAADKAQAFGEVTRLTPAIWEVSRVLPAASATFWAHMRSPNPAGYDPEAAAEFSHFMESGEATASGKNPVAELARTNETLRNINPRLPELFGTLAEAVADPVNLAAAGAGTLAARRVAMQARRLSAAEVLDLMSAPKSLMAAGDVSALGRQGVVLSVVEPRAAIRAARNLARSTTEAGFTKVQGYLATHPRIELAEKSKLFLGALRPGGGEEMFASAAARKLPHVAAAERWYSGYLDTLRLASFAKYADELEAMGLTAEANPKAFQDIARWVNVVTGRGELGAFEKVAPALNAALFSPRLAVSRFQALSPVRLARMEPAARRIALRKLAAFAGAAGATLTLAHVAGADVTLDPRSPDFGKIVVGKTHYELFAGFPAAGRFLFRFAGAARNLPDEMRKGGSVPRGLTEMTRRFLNSQAVAEAGRFGRTKLAPLPSLAADAYEGKKLTGEEFKWTRAAAERLAPLVASDLYEAFQEDGSRGLVRALPAVAGVGVQTYDATAKGGGRDLVARGTSQGFEGGDPEAEAELKRLGIVVKRVGRRYGMEGVSGDTMRFGGESLSMPPEKREELERAAYAAVLADVVRSVRAPGYRSFEGDGARRKFLEGVVKHSRERVMNEFRLKVRTEDIDRRRKLEERLKRMGNNDLRPLTRKL